MTATQTETRPTARIARVRHIVELDDRGKPFDRCVCGYLWDVFPVPFVPGAPVCEECVKELERQGGG